MKIEIRSTTKIVHLNGVPARIWEGKTSSGIPVHCYITRVAHEIGLEPAEFLKELEEHEAPSPEVEAIPLRMIL